MTATGSPCDPTFSKCLIVRLFDPGYLEEDYPVTMFFLKQDFKFFCKLPNKIEVSTMHPL